MVEYFYYENKFWNDIFFFINKLGVIIMNI